jgi:hypothetical protein
LFGTKHSERLRNGTVQELSSGDAWISDISADGDNGLVALDSRHNRILEVPTGNQHAWRVLVPASQLRHPSSVVLKGDFVYVIDKSNSCLQVFKTQNGSSVQTIDLVQPFPDKLVAGDHELVGITFSTKTILRFLISDKSTRDLEGRIVAVQTTVLPSLQDPIDLAIMGSLYYVLDRGRNQLAVWSPVIGDLTFTPYNPFAASPKAIASDGTRLYFADDASGTFQVLQRVEAADFLFNGNDTSRGLVQLYQYLLKNDLLPRQVYSVQPGDTVESIVEAKTLLPAGFTNTFDELFCKLNRQNCTNGHPVLIPGAQVVLPNLPLQAFVGKKYVDLDALQKNTKRPVTFANLSTLIASIPDGRQKLEEYNPGLQDGPLDQQTTGKLNIPAIIVRTTAMIPSEVRAHNDSLRNELKGKAQIFELASEVKQKQVESLQPVSSDSQSMSIPTGGPKVPPSYFATIHRLSVPFAATAVGIVDFPLNDKHPEFLGADGISSRLSQYVAPGSNVSATSTVLIASSPQGIGQREAGRLDHGTHTAALIGGTKVGVNPGVEIKYVKFGDFPAAVTEGSIKIFNLSLGEPEYATTSLAQGGVADVLGSWRDLMEKPENLNTLFVVAAGNEASTVSNTMLAAAGVSSNVIVVSAADNASPAQRWLDGDGVHGANVSVKYVNVFAPGQKVESATFDGSYAFASGTSQATAIVTGLASFLHASNSTWAPWQIKERIIATSDLDPWFPEKYSTGGLINVHQALNNPNADYVSYYDDQSHELIECSGSISDAEASRQLTVKSPSLVSPIYLQLSTLKRLHKNAVNMLSIIYESQNPARASDPDHGWDLQRVPEQVPLNALSNFNDISWIPDPAGPCAGMSKLNLGQVIDFIGRMR